jgi:hypothetical protein
LANKQHGAVSRQQLLGAGIPGGTIDAAVRREFLYPAIRSAYSVGRPELSEAGIWSACVLAAGPGSALAGRAAAKAWGFEKRHQSPVNVVRAANGVLRAGMSIKAHGHNRRARLEVRRCSWLRDEHVTRELGIPILQIEPLLLQLAGELNGEAFQYMFWEADRIRGLNNRRLEACVDISRRLKGGEAFREAVDCRLPNIEETRSLLEVLLKNLSQRADVPPPIVNRDAEGHLIDFRWPDFWLAVETDGYEFHRGHGSFERDTETNNDLRAAGWTVLRFTYRMLKYRPDYVIATILKALASAGRPGPWTK